MASCSCHPNLFFVASLAAEDVGGMRYCVGADVLDQQQMRMTR